MDAREKELREMAEQFPDSPLPWFSLGKHLALQRRFEEAAQAFETCVRHDAAYAAALYELGSARAALGEDARAREAYAACERAALAQGHPTLAADARERAEEL